MGSNLSSWNREELACATCCLHCVKGTVNRLKWPISWQFDSLSYCETGLPIRSSNHVYPHFRGHRLPKPAISLDTLKTLGDCYNHTVCLTKGTLLYTNIVVSWGGRGGFRRKGKECTDYQLQAASVSCDVPICCHPYQHLGFGLDKPETWHFSPGYIPCSSS